MKVTQVVLRWFGDEVLQKAKTALDIAEVAFRIEARAKINVTDNGQVDTGFMRASIYTVTKSRSSYGESSGDAHSRRKRPSQRMAGQVSLVSNADAAVVAGAVYSIWQERRKSFLEKAAQEVTSELPGVVKTL